jgi:Domain of unknown function (DUF4173)
VTAAEGEARAARPRWYRLPGAAAVPAWFAPAALALAAGAGLALPGRPAGLGLALVGAGLCAAVAAVARPRDPFAIGCWIAAAALSVVPAVRAAGWVVALSLAGALALAAVAAGGARTWRQLGAAMLGTLAALVPGPLAVGALVVRRIGARGWGRLAPAARGGVLAALLLAVFLPLLTAADAAFAELLDDAWAWEPEIDRVVERIASGLLVLAVGGGLLLVALRRAPGATAPARRRLGRTELAIALGALDVAFAAFVAVQLTTLFGGHRHVLETAGLTYAEYARSGFVQLDVVAALTLAVVGASARWGHAGDRLVRVLLGLLCVLTLVMLVSALRRLGLYVDAFGATRLRLLVHAQLLWLGAVFVLLVAAGAARRTAALPRAAVAVSAAFALGFAASDPDARIAERNVERFEDTGRVDERYLDGLSADAAPAIARLPRRLAACATERVRGELRTGDGIAGANLGRARAREALAPLADAVC